VPGPGLVLRMRYAIRTHRTGNAAVGLRVHRYIEDVTEMEATVELSLRAPAKITPRETARYAQQCESRYTGSCSAGMPPACTRL
jgi:hypothetical protein